MKNNSKLSSIKGLIFDVDGTLIDSLGMWKALDKLYLSSRGIEPPPGLSAAIEGLGFDDTARYFKREFGLTDIVEKIVREIVHWRHPPVHRASHSRRDGGL